MKETIVKELSERFKIEEAVLNKLLDHPSHLGSLDEATRQLYVKIQPSGDLWKLGDPAHPEMKYQSLSRKDELVIKEMNYTYLSNAVGKIERDRLMLTMPFTYVAMKSELQHRDASMKIQPKEPTVQAAPLAAVAAGGHKVIAMTDSLIGLEKHSKMMLSAMKLGIPTLLIGETGTGKTSLARLLATSTLKKKVVRVNLDGGATPDELIGRYQLKGTETIFELGIVPNAMKDGAILILDELNAALPDTLFALHPLLEDPSRILITETGEDIRPAEGFCVVATMNPSHEYAGTKQLNAALYSRFGVVLRFDTLRGDKMMRALQLHAPSAPVDSVAKIALIMETVERLRHEDKVNTRITIREGIAALTLSMDGLSLDEAIEASIVGKLEDYERKEVVATGVTKAMLSTAYGLGKMSITEVLEKASLAVKLEREVLKLQKELKAFEKLQDALKAMTIQGKEEVLEARTPATGTESVGVSEASAVNSSS